MTTPTPRATLATAFDAIMTAVASDPLATPPSETLAEFVSAYRDGYDDGRTARSDLLAIHRDAIDGASDPATRAVVSVAIGHTDDAVRASAGRSATDAAPTLTDVAGDRIAYLLASASAVLATVTDDDPDAGATVIERASDLLSADRADIAMFVSTTPTGGIDPESLAVPATVRRYDWTSAPSGAGRGGRAKTRDLSTVPSDSLTLSREYDGVDYVCTVDVASETFTVDGVDYDSPSAAASDGAGAGSTNGWTFWTLADGRTLSDAFDADGQWIDADD